MKNLPPVKAKKRVRSPNRGSSLLEELNVPEGLHMNEQALLSITKILDGYKEPPGIDWPKQEKEELSFTSWALEEILLLVWDHPWTLASETIEKFAMKMMAYMAMAVSEDQKRIFTVAAETAWELLDEIQLLEL